MKSWLKYEKRFQDLSESLRPYRLDYQRTMPVSGGHQTYWNLQGGIKTGAVQQFETLSEMAGKALKQVLPKKDPLSAHLEDNDRFFWYEALRLRSGQFKQGYPAQEFDDAGNMVSNVSSGMINHICDASANLCLKLHKEHPIVQYRPWYERIWQEYGKKILVSVLVAGILYLIGCFSGLLKAPSLGPLFP